MPKQTPPPPPPPPRTGPGAAARLQDVGDRTVRFFRAYTAGVSQRSLTELFDRDAARAVTVLVGDLGAKDDQGRVMRAAKVSWAFLKGLAFRLSPARRMLFAAALLAPLLGLLDLEFNLGATAVSIDVSPFWFLVSLAGMMLLLALELVDRVRVRDELEVARALQRDLLPNQTPLVPGYAIAHSARTANEIGGDYYDFVPLEDGRWALAVGDASGHGIGAGLLMAIAHATFRTALDADPTPESTLTQLNRVLCCTGGSRAFMTFFYGLLDPATGELDYAIAGHPYPMIRRADGTVEEIGEGGLPLGIRPLVQVASGSVRIDEGDTLVLYSDGLPEAAPGDEGSVFGFDRLAQLVAAGGRAEAVHDRILLAVHDHLGSEPMLDDLTLVVVERAG